MKYEYHDDTSVPLTDGLSQLRIALGEHGHHYEICVHLYNTLHTSERILK